MDIANTAPIERIARVLAGHELSRNAEGNMDSVGEAVDGLWPDYVDGAVAVLKTLRNPAPGWLLPATSPCGSA